jgi:hypothetical protein
MSGNIDVSKIISSMDAMTLTTASSQIIHPKKRILQSFVLIWLDPTIEPSKEEYQNNLAKLHTTG